MARRNVLRGASTWEREEKVNQQRDYAAQLQEQVWLTGMPTTNCCDIIVNLPSVGFAKAGQAGTGEGA
ncbi:hypothetical protein P3T76_015887 [Phytophthora citrophthora]|uniref:Uncharacterized protein n=1 Tax=Phytophthora citrophthora TaxID=4793 RepID=A0AAD9LAN7_9STRA|nr:hypothetical protein P3T76_015887 [Phytophthora citrophthora]